MMVKKRPLRFLKVLIFVLLALLLIAALHIRTDIPVEKLMEEYGGAPSKFMEIDGMQLHYRDEGEGEPIVLIHGAMASLHTWDGWTEDMLQAGFRVIRLDLPAFGLTGPNADGEYGFDYYADIVAELLDNLNVEKSSMAGNSLGGGVTWAFASRYPGRTDKIILVDAAGFALDEDLSSIGDLAGISIIKPFVRYFTPRYIIGIFVSQVYGDSSKIADETLARYYRLLRREGNREVLYNLVGTVNSMDEADLRERLASIQAPTLIMWGDKDLWIPLENAYMFQESITGSELIVYEGAGHVPMEEIPAETGKDAIAFLQE